jgi:hypothetical protein
MSTANTSDLVAAIASLSGALETVERISAAHDEEIAQLNTKRKSQLVWCAAEFLPAINKRVLAKLRSEFPEFVTLEIQQAFAKHAKFLGIFGGSGYEQALSMLKTRMASYLDETKYVSMEIDDQIAELSQRLEHLRTQGKETRELLKLLDQALKKSLPLPPQVTEHVTKIAATYRARQHKAAHYSSRGNARVSSTSHVSTEEVDDYNDVMLYMATGFPTSTRTLLWDMIQTQQETTVETIRGGGGSFGGAGADGGWSSTDSNTQDATSGADMSGSASAAMAVGAGVAAVAVGGVVMANDGFGLNPSSDSAPASAPAETSQSIATDDSLGAYS